MRRLLVLLAASLVLLAVGGGCGGTESAAPRTTAAPPTTTSTTVPAPTSTRPATTTSAAVPPPSTTAPPSTTSTPASDGADEVEGAGITVAPAVEWSRGYGTDHEEHVHEGLQAADGGYVAIGHLTEALDTWEGPTDVLVVKVAADGTEEWQRRIGTPDAWDVGYAVAEVDDGYVLGVGLSEDGRQRRALVKLDADGEVVWQRTYDGDGQGAVRGLDVLDDGSILATGYVASPDPGFLFIADDASAFLLAVDADGEVRWDRTLDLPQGTKVRGEAASTIAVLSTAWVESGDADAQNMVVVRTDAEGLPLARFEVGGGEHVQAFDFDVAHDGGLVLAGHSPGLGGENWDCAVARLGPDGDLRWLQRFGQPRGYEAAWVHDECYGVRVLPDGTIAVAGGTGDEYEYSASGHASGASDEWKAYLLLLDDQGGLLAEGVYGRPDAGNNATEYVAVTADGGLMLFNDTDAEGDVAPNNFGFMKLAPVAVESAQAGESSEGGNEAEAAVAVGLDPLTPLLQEQLGDDPRDWYLHDPSRLVVVDGTNMLAGTGKAQEGGYDCGLETWYLDFHDTALNPGQCLLRDKPAWVAELLPHNDGAYWAPGIRDERSMYYSVQAGDFDQEEVLEGINGACMGLLHASGTAPDLTWSDAGRPVLCAEEGEFNTDESEPSAIDPAYLETADGRAFVVYGGGHIWSLEVDPATGLPLGDDRWNPDDPYQHHLAEPPLIGVNGVPPEPGESEWIEAPFLLEYEGGYWLFVNWYGCCMGAESTYEIRVGRSDAPTGPFLDRDGVDLREGGGTLLLASDDRHAGPGHAGLLPLVEEGGADGDVDIEDDGAYLFTYHLYPRDEQPWAWLGLRLLTFEISEEGWPTLGERLPIGIAADGEVLATGDGEDKPEDEEWDEDEESEEWDEDEEEWDEDEEEDEDAWDEGEEE